MFFPPPNNSFFLPQWLFLPQIYKIGTLILQSLIYTPKFLPIISGNVLPKFKKLQTLIFFLIESENQNPQLF